MTTKKEIFECDRTNNAFEFLLFSYFGIVSDVEEPVESDDILEKLIERAYRDAASHVLSVNDDVKEDKKQEAIETIKEAIDNLKEIESVVKGDKTGHDNYDKWHEQLCKILVEMYDGHCKDGYTFTYGIAQKWVNMTMKYVYVVYYIAESCEFLIDFKEEFDNLIFNHRRSFHVPIDSYIYKAVKDDLGIKPLKSSWSKIPDYATYIDYQESIRKQDIFDYSYERICGYTPIDWEGKAWIEIAKNTK